MVRLQSKNFNSAHQLFGIAIILAMVAQFVLGFIHHRIYKRTLAPTKLAPIHVWLGRIVIPCGIANGFLGFPLALNPKSNYGLAALTILVIIVLCVSAFWRRKRTNQRETTAFVGVGDGQGGAGRSWTNPGDGETDIALGQMGSEHELPYPEHQQSFLVPSEQGREFV